MEKLKKMPYILFYYTNQLYNCQQNLAHDTGIQQFLSDLGTHHIDQGVYHSKALLDDEDNETKVLLSYSSLH